ncbi:MAG: acylneuraminate cytidylyltransferase family protein [Nitrospirae bacterium]|nr:acylneuraminate cytidylyltransferase family protein [Nitrospirota bacterium]
MKKKVLCVIPARGGSKGLPSKNTRLLNGKPLVSYVIATALQSSLIDKTIVSTDNEEIASVAVSCGAEVPFLRPAELAQDSSTLFPVLIHAMQFFDVSGWHADIVISFQPTSPLTPLADLDNGISKIIETGCDSVASVCEIDRNHPFRALKVEGDKIYPLTEYTNEKHANRQDRPLCYSHNGAFYIRTREVLEKWTGTGFALGEDQRAVIMDRVAAVNIDGLLDFKLAEIILKEKLC